MKHTIPSFLLGAAVASAVWAISISPGAKSEVSATPPVAEPSGPAEPAASEPAAAEPAAVEPVAEPDPATAEPAAAEAQPAPPAPMAPPAPGEAREEGRRERRGPPRWEEMTDEQRDEMRQRFRRMHDEHATRVVETFVERNGLEPADGERVFAVVDAMNERALARIGLWTDYVQLQGTERLPRDQGAAMMRDLFDDLVKGYEELDETFGPDWRENDPDFDLGRMVDPEVWGSLFRLGGGFGGPGPRGPGRGFGGGPRGPGGPAPAP